MYNIYKDILVKFNNILFTYFFLNNIKTFNQYPKMHHNLEISTCELLKYKTQLFHNNSIYQLPLIFTAFLHIA